MKSYFSYYLSVILVLITLQSNAQDTTVVQTFTWDSTARSSYFDFPDDQDKNYEKILMIYNMRCHDAAVGNGSVGCREWDYSCNTFLYVPEKQDSSLAFQYDYDVSQHSDDYFAYTDETHYTYYAFDKIQTNYKKTNSEYSIEVGGNNGSEHLDANTPGKLHILYSAQELLDAELTAGDLHGLALNFQGVSEFHRARIRMGNTTDTTLNLNNLSQSNVAEVFYNDQLIADGFNRFNFHTPFEWDGASNLMIELAYESVVGDLPQIITDSPETQNQCLQAESPSGSSLEFGGSWGIELDKEIFSSINDQITVALWVFGRPQSLPNRNTTLLEGMDANGKRTINIHLPWSNSSIYWDCGNEGGSYDRINKGSNPEEFEGKWHHWAFTKNTTTGSMKIYLDGQLWHSGVEKFRPMDIQSFRLGSSVSHSLGYYGMLDDVIFLNTELDEVDINTLMSGSDITGESWFGNVLAFYNMEEGAGNMIFDSSPNNSNAYFEGGPEWRQNSGRHIHNNFVSLQTRPVIKIYRGDYNIEQESEQILDTLITPKNSVIKFAVEASELLAIDTFFTWEAVDSKIFDEFGEELESVYVEPIDFLFFEELSYFTFKESKFELLSLVTPYGNGLDLGPAGKTFTFDVTDFAPVLKGNRRLSLEMGGQSQEEIDIKFLFIEGIPSRNVLDINNIWPFARGYYQSILDDKIFEPRMVNIPSHISQAKIRSSITGHGQNGEFVSRNHRIHLGNTTSFQFDVWKECAFNPIYPQGGTWIYDRAGWCPGMATDLHEFDITPHVTPGSEVEIEYNVFGPYMDQANYLVSNQLVFYGEPNFNTDASLEHIVRPNQDAVEFARFNPNCTDPAVVIKNNGKTALQSLTINYGVEGISEKQYSWTGNLAYLESTEVTLPVDDLGFYGAETTNTFFARIEGPNGGTDEYGANNSLRSKYQMPDVYEGYERWLLRVRTNNRAAENKYKLVDQAGNVVLSRQSLTSNTTYDDEITLPAGCYSFEITDSGNDGLSFWNNPAAGSGWVSIRRIVNDGISFEKIKFESDFGGAFQYDFIIDESVGTSGVDVFKRVSMFPNPAQKFLTVEIEGLEAGNIYLQITNSSGQNMHNYVMSLNQGINAKKINIEELAAGHYVLKLFNQEGSWVKSFIKL